MDVKVANHSDRTLSLPNSQLISNDKVPVLVREFDKFATHPVVEAWVGAGALVVSDADDADEAKPVKGKGKGSKADDKGGNTPAPTPEPPIAPVADAPKGDEPKADEPKADEPAAPVAPAVPNNPFAK